MRKGITNWGYRIVAFAALAAIAAFLYFGIYQGWVGRLDVDQIIRTMAQVVSPV